MLRYVPCDHAVEPRDAIPFPRTRGSPTDDAMAHEAARCVEAAVEEVQRRFERMRRAFDEHNEDGGPPPAA